MTKTVFLDRQHAGQIHKPSDLGAFSRLVGRAEADMTLDYLAAAERYLRALKVDVINISDGRYKDRHRRVIDYAQRAGGVSVYVAAHLNAGGGDYGAMFHDHRSTMGKEVSEYIGDALSDACPELNKVIVKSSQPDDWTKNAFATISGVYAGKPCGVCFEPCFVDNESHVPLLEHAGLERIGDALGAGIFKWMENR
jgi:N-acetylmuramoyl-L-alanine amidase